MNDEIDDFIVRAGFMYGWSELESWARRMAEQAVKEITELKEGNKEMLEALIDACRTIQWERGVKAIEKATGKTWEEIKEAGE